MIETRSERFCFDCAPTGIHNTSYKFSGGQVTIIANLGHEFRSPWVASTIWPGPTSPATSTQSLTGGDRRPAGGR